MDIHVKVSICNRQCSNKEEADVNSDTKKYSKTKIEIK